MVNGSVSIYLIGQGRSASDLQNLIICKVEMKVAGSMGNGCQKRVELIFIDFASHHCLHRPLQLRNPDSHRRFRFWQ